MALSEIANTTMPVDSVAAIVQVCRDTAVEMWKWNVGHQLCRKFCTWSGDEAIRSRIDWNVNCVNLSSVRPCNAHGYIRGNVAQAMCLIARREKYRTTVWR